MNHIPIISCIVSQIACPQLCFQLWGFTRHCLPIASFLCLSISRSLLFWCFCLTSPFLGYVILNTKVWAAEYSLLSDSVTFLQSWFYLSQLQCLALSWDAVKYSASTLATASGGLSFPLVFFCIWQPWVVVSDLSGHLRQPRITLRERNGHSAV